MIPCPICQQRPNWFLARRVSDRERKRHFILRGCVHAEAFGSVDGSTDGRQMRFVPRHEIEAEEAKWTAHAEKLFTEYTICKPWSEERRKEWTERVKNPPPSSVNWNEEQWSQWRERWRLPESADSWTDAKRAAYRARIWPPAFKAELIDRNREETPAYSPHPSLFAHQQEEDPFLE